MNTPSPSAEIEAFGFHFKKLSEEEQKRRDEERVRADNLQRDMKISELVRGSQLPKRHMQLQSKAGDDSWSRASDAIWSLISSSSGPIVGICGVRGNGKTQLAVEAARQAITGSLRAAFYTTAISFFSRVQAAFSNKEETTQEIIQDLRKPYLLIIDEIGKRSDSNWENNLLFELINHRYNDMKPTILIDNRSKSDFIAGVGPSIASRMQETGGIIEANWESWRK